MGGANVSVHGAVDALLGRTGAIAGLCLCAAGVHKQRGDGGVVFLAQTVQLVAVALDVVERVANHRRARRQRPFQGAHDRAARRLLRRGICPRRRPLQAERILPDHTHVLPARPQPRRDPVHHRRLPHARATAHQEQRHWLRGGNVWYFAVFLVTLCARAEWRASCMDRVRQCVEIVLDGGPVRECVLLFRTNECQTKLDAYVSCMREHEHKRPDKYEPEFCASERQLYRHCRSTQRS
jgi:hypothetical protein